MGWWIRVPATDWADLEATEAAARLRLPEEVYDYFAGGAGDETTLAANGASWRQRLLAPRVLRGVRGVDASVEVLGCRMSTPIAVAPMGMQRMAHPDGEIATAAAAAATGTVLSVSTYATSTVEEVAAAGGVQWFQAYVLRDRGLSRDLLQRAAAAGYRAVLLTVDAPMAGDRRRDRRHGYRLPTGANLRLANFPAGGQVSAGYSIELENTLTPDLIGWVADVSGLPVAVKGVLRGDDAKVVVAAGASGVVVSNHGGRQVDGAVPTADALVEVAGALSGTPAHILVDGGIRTGTDAVRALALGAHAVLVGRPVLWALAVGGEAGVRGLLTTLREDLLRTMALCGVSSVAEIGPDLLRGRMMREAQAG
jgi:4-hydroxymandelate oxidase